MSLQFTSDIPEFLVKNFPGNQVFHSKKNGVWGGITSEDFLEEINKLSLILLSGGVDKGECVASIFSYNSYEWNIIDLALAQIGAVHLPIYPTISDSDYHFILSQAEVRWIFITDQVIYNKLSQLRPELPRLASIISIEKLPSVDHFSDLIGISPVHSMEYNQLLKKRRNAILPSDVCTILYTSGTTGFPKGVMLTHQNLCSNIETAARLQPLTLGDKVLCFLPLCHIYQRTAVYQFIIKGVEVYYAENLRALLQNMKEVRPEGTTVVPRVLEKILTGIVTRARKSTSIKRLFMKWSIRLGYRFNFAEKTRFPSKWSYFIADKLVYRSVRATLGGHLRYVGCGGAPVNERILRFFWAAGIPVYEGYGLTESSPLVCVNFPGENNIRFGSVGKPVENVHIRISEEGEILVKGPNVMKGYYKNKELTEATLHDNWLYTGDLGEITEGGFLRLIGRKKEMFKTSYGKYIVPQAIESRFLDSPLIDYLIVIGEGRHYAAAIVSPNIDYARTLLPKSFTGTGKDITERPEIIGAVRREIEQVNRKLGKTEQIKKHLIVEDQWTVETGELSATHKLKRNIILLKYAARIRELYKEDSWEEL
jgi:long-chain acyl-CoA synthetase